MNGRRYTLMFSALAAGLPLVVAGCVGETSGGGSADTGGGEVELLTGFTGEDAERLEASLQPFEDETGIDVVHVGINSPQSVITTRVEAGDPPDVALFPQPGLVTDLVAQGDIQPVDDVVDVDQLTADLLPGLLDTTTVDGQLYAVPFRVSLKSLVWYPPQAFEQAGYSVPTTYEDFTALVDQMREDGNTPLCLGVESGPGTGWAATDWFEDLLLRSAGPEVYDQWVSHDLPFDSPEVRQVAEMFEQLAFTDGNVRGGRQGIVSIAWADAILPMFDDPPGCWMEKQGNFVANSLPEGVELGTDVDAFYFPALATGGYDGNPVLGGGDLAGLLTDNEAAKELIRYLATPESGIGWAEQGGFLSPWTTFDSSTYPDDATRGQAEILSSADAFRFDGSDLMPAAVGAGTFFSEVTAWINDEKSLDDALAAIDGSWPS